jgi:hypothetical protein
MSFAPNSTNARLHSSIMGSALESAGVGAE